MPTALFSQPSLHKLGARIFTQLYSRDARQRHYRPSDRAASVCALQHSLLHGMIFLYGNCAAYSISLSLHIG